MKFWKKIYFSVFLLFLVFLNAGISLVFYISYSSGLREEKTRLIGENEVIRRSLSDDISAFGKKRPNGRELTSIMADYENSFRQNGLRFELWQNGDSVFRSDGLAEGETGQKDAIVIERKDGVQTAYLSTSFDVGVDSYQLMSVRALAALTKQWDQLKWGFLLLSGVLSAALAVILYVLTRRLTEPLNRLARLTKGVAEGDYGQFEVRGDDEIAELGREFNTMAAAVRGRIESRQRFVANLAHELRTPLTSISGYSEYLLRGNANEERQYRALEYIHRESRRMQQMSGQLLLLARVQGEPFEMSDVSVEACVREAEASCEPLAGQKSVSVRCGGEDFFVSGSRELLVCLFRNFIENAVRACPEGGEVRAGWGGGKVEIRDNGIGMKPDEIERIAEPFYRIDKARSRDSGGTGLGLALCAEIAELHGAKVSYVSEVGQGTVVTVIFTTS